MDFRILIAEDERIVAVDLRNRLANLGYKVVDIVARGEQAVRVALEVRPDLVLMDIGLMGAIDGIAAAQSIRSQQDIPVVFLTAYSDGETLQRAKIAEPFGYVLKPFEERELRTTIEMALFKHASDKQLKQNQRWLSTVLKSIGDAVIATDEQGMISFMNPVAEDLTGWLSAAAVGRPIADVFVIVSELSPVTTASISEEILRGEGSIIVTKAAQLTAQSGRRVSVDVSAAPLRDEKGDIKGVVISFRDVTARLRDEVALSNLTAELEMTNTELRGAKDGLEKSFSVLRATLEATADGILVVDLAGNVTSFNRKFLEMWQISGKTAINDSDEELMDLVVKKVLDTEKFTARTKMLYAHQEMESFDTIELNDGRTFERYSQPQRIGNEIVGRVWSFRDATERHKAEESLLLPQFTIDNAFDPIFWTDSHGVVTFVNLAGCKFLDLPRFDIIGKKIIDFAFFLIDRSWEDFWAMLKSELSVSFSDTVTIPGNGEATLEKTASYMEYRNKGYAVIVSHNVTSNARGDEFLRANNGHSILAPQSVELGAFDWDIGRDHQRANTYLAALLGYSMEEINGDGNVLSRLLHPDDAAKAAEQLRRHLDGQTKFFSFDCRLQHKDGSWIPVHDYGRVIDRDRNGKPLRGVGIVTPTAR
ncbi:MAG: PAS domain S-box protein [Ignavibacteriales bacterium]|nr:PAS domain S-box protein [Ignavibacteriales bacterium]